MEVNLTAAEFEKLVSGKESLGCIHVLDNDLIQEKKLDDIREKFFKVLLQDQNNVYGLTIKEVDGLSREYYATKIPEDEVSPKLKKEHEGVIKTAQEELIKLEMKKVK